MNERAIVISDIHLSQPPMPLMMRHPAALANFIGDLPRRAHPNERVHLIVAGDFIDFLAMQPFDAITLDSAVAGRKLLDALAGENACVVEALRSASRDGVRLVVMAGNHDLELAHPAVQNAFMELLGDIPMRPEFIVHGQAWRRGGLLVEHGNRYDGANENDWDGMRELVSSQSRGQALHTRDKFNFGQLVHPSAGSQLVTQVLNSVRHRYPFVPLMQPEGVLTALLLRVLEPSLGFDWKKVARLLQTQEAAQRNAPSGRRNIAATTQDGDAELDRVFGEEYRSLLQPAAMREIGATDWLRLFASERADSIAQCLRRGEVPSSGVLQRLQLLLRRMHLDEAAFSLSGDTGELGAAAAMMHGREGIQTVVMGHTHVPRQVGDAPIPSYINTGTWTDFVRVPPEAMIDSANGRNALSTFLGNMCRDDAASRTFEPTFAEIELCDDVVLTACLRRADH